MTHHQTMQAPTEFRRTDPRAIPNSYLLDGLAYAVALILAAVL